MKIKVDIDQLINASHELTHFIDSHFTNSEDNDGECIDFDEMHTSFNNIQDPALRLTEKLLYMTKCLKRVYINEKELETIEQSRNAIYESFKRIINHNFDYLFSDGFLIYMVSEFVKDKKKKRPSYDFVDVYGFEEETIPIHMFYCNFLDDFLNGSKETQILEYAKYLTYLSGKKIVLGSYSSIYFDIFNMKEHTYDPSLIVSFLSKNEKLFLIDYQKFINKAFEKFYSFDSSNDSSRNNNGNSMGSLLKALSEELEKKDDVIKMLVLVCSYCIYNNIYDQIGLYVDRYLERMESIFSKLSLNGLYNYIRSTVNNMAIHTNCANLVLSEIVKEKPKAIIK